MKVRNVEMFTNKSFQYVTDDGSSVEIYKKNHKDFHERLRKTLYYGKYTDGTLPSPPVTEVAVKFINAKTSGKKSLDRCHAVKMTRRARISPCALMMGILYTERLAQSNPGYLKKVSSSDLFMVSMLVASKYLYDDGEDEDAYNYDWSKAGNYHVVDLNKLEREFLNSIEWKIFVSSKEFFEFVNKIETRVALDQGAERGWYSYLDIGTFLENAIFQDFLKKYVKNTGKVILSCAVVYSFSVALLLGSPAFVSGYYCFEQQDIVDMRKDLRVTLMPPMSFIGQIGHLEHAMAMSLSYRKRQPNHQDVSKPTQVNRKVSYMKGNCTQKAFSPGKNNCTCNCGHSDNPSGQNEIPVPVIRTASSKLPEPKGYFGHSDSSTTYNKIGIKSNKAFRFSFNQVLAVMKFPFNCSWMYLYETVKFPVWENSYSDILVGFSTSINAAAA